MERLIHGAGTSEDEWRGCANLNTLPVVELESLVPVGSRLVVCAPHPDDEILPCAALVGAAFASGRTVTVIAISDGEASHGPEATLSPDDLRRTRPGETMEALRRLRVDADVQRLGLPDGKLGDFEGLLQREFSRRFQRTDVVITPWRWDGHPDHESVTRAALAARARVGFATLETPIWGWHWSRPKDTPMPWKNAVRFPVDESRLRAKAAAIAAFESQLRPREGAPAILTDATLERFTRPWEIYFR